MKSRWFRYGFLIFFLVMFCQMLFTTALVFSGAQDLRQVVTLLWTFRLPWQWALPRRRGPLGRPVRLRFLQRNAYLHGAGPGNHGSLQTPLLVRLLPPWEP